MKLELYCTDDSNESEIYSEPQAAPWPVSTRLLLTGMRPDYKFGFVDKNGETIWCHTNGVEYRVIKTTPPQGMDYDPETGEPLPLHGWSTLQSVLDPNCESLKAIDVESMAKYTEIGSD